MSSAHGRSNSRVMWPLVHPAPGARAGCEASQHEAPGRRNLDRREHRGGTRGPIESRFHCEKLHLAEGIPRNPVLASGHRSDGSSTTKRVATVASRGNRIHRHADDVAQERPAFSLTRYAKFAINRPRGGEVSAIDPSLPNPSASISIRFSFFVSVSFRFSFFVFRFRALFVFRFSFFLTLLW